MKEGEIRNLQKESICKFPVSPVVYGGQEPPTKLAIGAEIYFRRGISL
jgi:hypothetical protein